MKDATEQTISARTWIGEAAAQRVGQTWREEDQAALIRNLRAADMLTMQLVDFTSEREVRMFLQTREGRASMEADQKLNVRGLVLPHAAISQLKKYGIYAQAAVSLQHQSVARRYVIRGVESGGAVREAGRYVTFAGENGEALDWLQPVDSLTVNGVHAIVVAPVLTRIEIFRTGRNGRTYELRITRHRPGSGEKGRRPGLEAEDIFRGRDGYLGLELWGKDKELAGTVLPQFFTRSGEELLIPEPFRAAARAVTGAVSCLNCEHSHFLMPASDGGKQQQRPQEAVPEQEHTATLFAVAVAQDDDRNNGLAASGLATGGF